METKSFTEIVLINLNHKTIFNILVDPTRHSQLVGASVQINVAPNSEFSVGGHESSIIGYVLETVPNNKLVLLWRLAVPDWPSEHFSTVTIELEPSNDGTTLCLNHKDIPIEFLEVIKSGWKEYYWDPLLLFVTDSVDGLELS